MGAGAQRDGWSMLGFTLITGRIRENLPQAQTSKAAACMVWFRLAPNREKLPQCSSDGSPVTLVGLALVQEAAGPRDCHLGGTKRDG